MSEESGNLKRENKGRYITDSLPALSIKPEVLDRYTETEPLEGLPQFMASRRLTQKIVWPKLSKKHDIIFCGWSIIRINLLILAGLLRMRFAQRISNRFVARKKEQDPQLLKQQIKDYVSGLSCICGFTTTDTRFIAHSKYEVFPYDTAIVIGMQVSKQDSEGHHYRGDKMGEFALQVKLIKCAFAVSRFIRTRGYRCYLRIPVDGYVKFTPLAINAGLGELGASGIAITRELGPNVRWAVISTCAEVENDEPVNLNMAAYCDACRLCIEECPAHAIPVEKVWWRGVLKRKIDDEKCWAFFSDGEWCGRCVKICPITRFGYNKCMDAYKKEGVILGKTS